MSSPLIIRPLKIWEIPQLLRFRAENDYKSRSETGYTRESILYSFLKAIWHKDRMVTYVALREGVIQGYISLVFGRARKFRGNVYIVSTAVAASERGKGIGTLLFAEVEKHAVGRNTRRLELEVFFKNTGAINLYKRLGYEIEGVKRHAVESATDHDDLVFMAKLLN